MTQQNTGGPAFPEIRIRGDNYNPPTKFYYCGMTLRDYFAAKSISAILAPNPVTGQFALVSDFDARAIMAYKMADAMLKARNSQ